MKYLITGITGFIGPHLANLLVDEGHEVAGLIRASNGKEQDILDVVPDSIFKKLRFVHGDLDNPESIERVFKENGYDGVFHLAAQSHLPTSFRDPVGTFKTNAVGTVTLVDALERLQPSTRLMFCSTSEVYGASPVERGKITEAFPIAPVNPYGVSKAAADLYVRERASSKGLPFFVIRAFSQTGPRRGKNFSISSNAYQIVRILKGSQEPVMKVGTLSSRRMVGDVRDFVRACYMLMEKAENGGAYNVAGDRLFSIGEILETMLEMRDLKGKVRLEVDPALVRPIDIPVQICDTTKARELTGWKPEIPFRDTLDDLLTYWEAKM